jgi:hypothetical protein
MSHCDIVFGMFGIFGIFEHFSVFKKTAWADLISLIHKEWVAFFFQFGPRGFLEKVLRSNPGVGIFFLFFLAERKRRKKRWSTSRMHLVHQNASECI